MPLCDHALVLYMMVRNLAVVMQHSGVYIVVVAYLDELQSTQHILLYRFMGRNPASQDGCEQRLLPLTWSCTHAVRLTTMACLQSAYRHLQRNGAFDEVRFVLKRVKAHSRVCATCYCATVAMRCKRVACFLYCVMRVHNAIHTIAACSCDAKDAQQ